MDILPYAVRDWSLLPKADGVNSYAGQVLPQRCKTLDYEQLMDNNKNGASISPCLQLELRAATQTQPVLPTLFVPGFPKCATTWLFNCMNAAFGPEMVCRDFDTLKLDLELR